VSVAADILSTIESRLDDATLVSTVDPTREVSDNGPDALPQTVTDRQFIVTIGDITRVPDLDVPGNPPREGWEVDYRIRARVMPSETDNTSTSVLAVNFLADARKAITGWSAYLHDWFTFGGYAIDADWSQVLERAQTDGTSSSDGYAFSLLVRIRVTPGEL